MKFPNSLILIFLVYALSTEVTVHASAETDRLEHLLNDAMAKQSADNKGSIGSDKRDLKREFAKPEANTEKIPALQNSFKPFERRHLTPDQEETYRRLVTLMWGTPLGQMFNFYLNNTDPPLEQAAYSRQLAHRIMVDSAQAGTRQDALNLMVGDLIGKGQFTPAMNARYLMLIQDLKSIGDAGMGKVKSRGVKVALLILATVAIIKYPGLQKTLEKYKRFKSLERAIPGAIRTASKYLFGVYNLWVTIAGSYLFVHWMGLDQGVALVGEATRDTALFYGLDELISALQ